MFILIFQWKDNVNACIPEHLNIFRFVGEKTGSGGRAADDTKHNNFIYLLNACLTHTKSYIINLQLEARYLNS